MKKLLILGLLLAWAGTAQSQHLSLAVEINGFSANWFEAKVETNATIIIFGGSEGSTYFGDLWAPKLNEMGFNVLSMAYFGTKDLPDQLELIPLEYLDKALEWLDKKHDNPTLRYGLIGVSKGAELALVQAGRLNRFNAVVALAPSSVIWQSINKKDFMSKKSSWTVKGEELAFLPYCFAKGYEHIFDFYDCALDSLDQNAVIEVSHIKAPLLLVSGGDDKLWPSQRMANMIMETLTAVNHTYPYLHKNYPTAGHWLVAPHLNSQGKGLSAQEMSSFNFLGGSADELITISNQVQHEVYEFLQKYVKQ